MSAFYECSEDFNEKQIFQDCRILLNEPIYTHFVHQCGLQLTKSSQRMNFFYKKTLKELVSVFYTFWESKSLYFPSLSSYTK